MARLEEFNVQPQEVVIVEGTIARTALIEPDDTGGQFSSKKRFVRVTNAHIVDASKGPNLAKYVESHIGTDENHWYTATTNLENIQVVDASTGSNIALQGELARNQVVRLAVNSFKPKNWPNMGSGLQAVSVASEADLKYVGQTASAAALFGLGEVAPATTQAPAASAQPATNAQPAAQPTADTTPTASNPFASGSEAPANTQTTPTNPNPFA